MEFNPFTFVPKHIMQNLQQKCVLTKTRYMCNNYIIIIKGK